MVNSHLERRKKLATLHKSVSTDQTLSLRVRVWPARLDVGGAADLEKQNQLRFLVATIRCRVNNQFTDVSINGRRDAALLTIPLSAQACTVPVLVQQE